MNEATYCQETFKEGLIHKPDNMNLKGLRSEGKVDMICRFCGKCDMVE